jgi:hypothetical protein
MKRKGLYICYIEYSNKYIFDKRPLFTKGNQYKLFYDSEENAYFIDDFGYKHYEIFELINEYLKPYSSKHR